MLIIPLNLDSVLMLLHNSKLVYCAIHVKKAPYGNVRIIFSVFLSFHPESLFLALEVSIRASASVLLFVDHDLG